MLDVEQAVRHAVDVSIHRIERAMDITLPKPEVRFDLRGKAAGQARMPRTRDGNIVLRFNRQLMRENAQAFCDEVAPHEVAHMAAYSHFGYRIKPHGKEWRWIMETVLDVPARVRHTMAVAVQPRKTFSYRCACIEQIHQLTAIRHNRIMRGERYYRCRRCGESLEHI